MMEGWEEIRLDELVEFQRGFDITKLEQSKGVIPVVSSSGINSFHNVAKNTPPGIVIGRKGTLGSVFYLKTPYWAHDTTLWSKEIKGNPRFIYYFLMGLKLERFDVGGANPTLNRNHIHSIKISIPPLPAQKIHRKFGGSYTFLMVTDRTELERQLYDTFTGVGAVTEQNVRAKSRNHLRELLKENHRYVFSLIHKFSIDKKKESEYPLITDRENRDCHFRRSPPNTRRQICPQHAF